MPSTLPERTTAATWMERIYQHHAWSNRDLIDFLSTLPEEQLALTVPGTYGDSLATIRHIIYSDADYVRIIPDAPEVPQIAQDGPFEGWDRFREVAQAADSALMAYVAGPTDDYFFVVFDEDQQTSFDLTRSMLLCQIIHHATEHRSQIRTTLSSHGITPPEISTGPGGPATTAPQFWPTRHPWKQEQLHEQFHHCRPLSAEPLGQPCPDRCAGAVGRTREIDGG